VISGDTSPVDAVIDACNGCDLLFHELFGLDFGPSGPRGAAQGHTSAVELGEVARRARPNRLVIYHDVNYGSEEAAIQAIKKSFSGEVTFARDLDVF
jgi:ribonuclease Z